RTHVPEEGSAGEAPAAAAPPKKSGALPWAVAAGVLTLAGGAYLLASRGDDAQELEVAAQAKPAPVEATPAVHVPEVAAEPEPEPEPEPEELPPYRLTIVTDPPGATVTVGKDEVVAPAELTFDERPKSVDVAAVLSGHRSVYQRLRPSAYEETERGNFEAHLEITLKPRGGAPAPSVTAEPGDAPEAKTPAPQPKPIAAEPKAEPKVEPEPKAE